MKATRNFGVGVGDGDVVVVGEGTMVGVGVGVGVLGWAGAQEVTNKAKRARVAMVMKKNFLLILLSFLLPNMRAPF
jgi:hypothetical protein